MRLIDADKLIEAGWVLTRHGQSNKVLTRMSIADVPTAFSTDELIKELENAKDPLKLLEASWLTREEKITRFKGLVEGINYAIKAVKRQVHKNEKKA
jgi:hypothetical protein